MATVMQEEGVSLAASGASVEEQWVLHSSSLEGDGLAPVVLVAPWGEVDSVNGSFVVDEESSRMVIEAFRAHGTDLPIDYEHQSLGGSYSSPTGQAPAAGWIRSLRIVHPDDDGEQTPGLYAEVEWTESARAKLSAKEYRYLSPVVIVRKRDRRVVALHSAALTNKPAITGMKPIVNREAVDVPEDGANPGKDGFERAGGKGHVIDDEEQMRMAKTVGLEMPEGAEEAVEVLRTGLGLPGDSDLVAVLAAAEERLGSLMREAANREAQERVEKAMCAGKLTPAQREWAMTLALRDPAGFDEWAVSAPVVVMLGRTESPSGVGDGRTRRDQTAVIASARAAYRSEPALLQLTTESAWVRNALREAGFDIRSDNDESK